jgi:hypothetical protein
LKDLDQVHFACRGLFYGDKDQTLLIDDELSKTFQNAKWSKFVFEPFRARELSKNKVHWLDLASWLWSALKALPLCKDSLCPFCSYHVVFEATI